MRPTAMRERDKSTLASWKLRSSESSLSPINLTAAISAISSYAHDVCIQLRNVSPLSLRRKSCWTYSYEFLLFLYRIDINKRATSEHEVLDFWMNQMAEKAIVNCRRRRNMFKHSAECGRFEWIRTRNQCSGHAAIGQREQIWRKC